MPIQSEAELENSLIDRLTNLGYSRVNIHTIDALHANLKQQLEIHNATALNNQPLSDGEFKKILNHLDKGSVFDRAKTLRDRFQLTRDDGTRRLHPIPRHRTMVSKPIPGHQSRSPSKAATKTATTSPCSSTACPWCKSNSSGAAWR